jgi:hypothetical protein
MLPNDIGGGTVPVARFPLRVSVGRMIVAFDINDRSTWDWVNGGDGVCTSEDEILINPEDRHSFYQCSNGVPYLQQCPRMNNMAETGVFDPRVGACENPANCSEADIYDWAVAQGLVNDER